MDVNTICVVLTGRLGVYDSNERVLTVEAGCQKGAANGLGNILGDFLAWFVWGVASRRAVYIRWTDCVGPPPLDGTGSVQEGRAPKCPKATGDQEQPLACNDRANLALFFELAGGRKWGLTPATHARISGAMRAKDISPRIVITPTDLPDDPKEFFDGILAGDDPWVSLHIHQGHGLIPWPNGMPGEGAAEDAHQAWHGAMQAWSSAVIADGYRSLAQLVRVDVSRGEADMTDFALVEGLFGVHLRARATHCLWVEEGKERADEGTLSACASKFF